MKTHTLLSIILMSVTTGLISHAQVGVNNPTPGSILDIQASSQANPLNTDGILIPRVTDLSDVDPGAEQDGMLIFLASPLGNLKKGLHYWDNSPKKWIPYGGDWLDSYNGELKDLSYANQANANGVSVVVLDNGRIGMGTDNPVASLEIKLPGDNDIQVVSASPPNAPNLIYYTKNGTFASGAFLNNNNPIGEITGKVWTGGGASGKVAQISSLADGSHSSGNLPTKFTLSTTASGNTSESQNGNELTIKATGKVGIGIDNPTAVLHLKAGSAGGNSAPMKFKAGSNLTTPENGAFEFDGTHLYFTPNTKRTILLKGLTNTVTLNFPLILNGVTSELTLPVPGATTGSVCECAPSGAIETGLQWSCYVNSANIVTIRLSNITSGLIDPVNRSWKVTVIE
ncbi:hypothetical protein ATE92_2639 [Ulvibacter sp. MAR_2010_11]|uniref:hypothetical protein n=1 Tax=Ulvibacter sp. MAR_2010_11 TaxID=1250229 RepID=UPI000CC7DDD4|nr:hypothetical protein [Ulvibacter sp. MAR_2010_11]PKA84449.1 hypothetical protein ATE92_2639 [Ulvibacter sp. MAR_2010_11]